MLNYIIDTLKFEGCFMKINLSNIKFEITHMDIFNQGFVEYFHKYTKILQNTRLF